MGNILGNVAKVSDFGLDTPVPLVLQQQRVVEEEARSHTVSDESIVLMKEQTHPE